MVEREPRLLCHQIVTMGSWSKESHYAPSLCGVIYGRWRGHDATIVQRVPSCAIPVGYNPWQMEVP